MITRDPQAILDALAAGGIPANSSAVAKGVFMVEPVNFSLSEETARDNRYMDLAKSADPDRALEQYVNLLALIRRAGVPVKSFPGAAETPDNVFPNNVFATAPGRFIVGHMLHPQRQREASRRDIREYFAAMDYTIFDLSVQDCVAELTGPLVIDRARRLGFCGMTGRVNEAGLAAMHEAFALRHTLQFDLRESEYHTNVVLSVLAGRACVLHAKSFVDPTIPWAIANIYGGRVLYLDQAEKDAFAGNCIALTPHDVFMSQTAADALQLENRALLESWGFRIHSTVLDEIEKAGGSLRCMVAEIF
jgi:hypothetical protein